MTAESKLAEMEGRLLTLESAVRGNRERAGELEAENDRIRAENEEMRAVLKSVAFWANGNDQPIIRDDCKRAIGEIV